MGFVTTVENELIDASEPDLLDKEWAIAPQRRSLPRAFEVVAESAWSTPKRGPTAFTPTPVQTLSRRKCLVSTRPAPRR